MTGKRLAPDGSRECFNKWYKVAYSMEGGVWGVGGGTSVYESVCVYNNDICLVITYFNYLLDNFPTVYVLY